MSSDTPSDDCPPAQTAVIPTKDLNNPEYMKYYYRQIEESVKRNAELYATKFPHSVVGKAFVSLSATQQKILISTVVAYPYIPEKLDVEDKKKLDFTTMMMFGNEVLRVTKPMQKRSKKPKSNSLLKSAVRHASRSKAKQMDPLV